ncbi:MAG: guanylate kinase [Myxococcales bacterium]|nr:guanylate kinase [Myxococcales bacterium]
MASAEGRKRRGRLFVVSAPSGAGKTSLIDEVLKRMPRLALSISHTTRKRRAHEVDGREYFFIDEPEFRRLIDAGAFLEYAKVHDNWYGTQGDTVERMRMAGRDVVLEIDCQGARQVKNAFPRAVFIFILPPSLEELERRLVARDSETPAELERRLANAKREFLEAPWYNYIVINDDFEEAAQDLCAIIRTEIIRQRDYRDLLSQFNPHESQS